MNNKKCTLFGHGVKCIDTTIKAVAHSGAIVKTPTLLDFRKAWNNYHAKR